MAEQTTDERLAEARSLLHYLQTIGRDLDLTDLEIRHATLVALQLYFDRWPIEFAKPENDRGSGFLYVALITGPRPLVTIDLGHDRNGHINFTPDEARGLSELLARKANEAEGFRL